MRDLASFLARQVGAALILGLVAAGLGDWALRPLRTSFAQRTGLALAIGLALCGQIGLLLAGAGGLRKGMLIPVAALGLVASVPWLLALSSGWLRHPVAAWLAVLTAAGLLYVALYPPLAFDETLYHLPFARAIASSGGLEFLDQMRVPVFPVLGELIQAELFLLAGDVATHFIAWCAVLATAVLLYAWASSGGNRVAGAIAAALWLGGPHVLYLGGTGYLEPLLALWVGGALFAAERFAADGYRRWAWIAGCLAGSAAAGKYLGLFFVGWAGVEIFLATPKGRWRPAVLYAAGAALAAGPTYLRLWLLTGNPLFPYASSIFGWSPWSPAQITTRPALEQLTAWLTLPWDAVFRRQLVGEMPPFSPFLLVAAPFVLSAAWHEARARRVLLFATAYSLIIPVHARYLVLAVPPVAVVAAREVARLLGERRAALANTAVAAGIVMLTLPGAAWLGFHLWRLGPLPVSEAGRDRFWSSHVRLWPAVRFLNRTAGPAGTVYAMGAEQMRAFSSGSLFGDHLGELPFWRADQLARRPEALRACLRTVDADYLVWPRRRSADTVPAEWRRNFELLYSDAAAEVFRVRDAPPADAAR